MSFLGKLFLTVFLICVIGGIFYIGYQDIKKQGIEYKEIYDSCDFFIEVTNTGTNMGDFCYSPYAYLRMKEDNRTGNYCFIAPNHNTIYHRSPCYQNMSEVKLNEN